MNLWINRTRNPEASPPRTGVQAQSTGHTAARPDDGPAWVASLLEASRAAAEADNLQDALEIIVRCAAQALDTPACIVYEFEAWGDLAMYGAKRFGRNRVYAYSMLTKTDA